MSQKKQEWGSRLGVILAVAGSAVGLGNFLRFPGNAAENGGGAFMIPYFCALLFLGIPIGWAEWAMGKYGGGKGFHSAPAIMGVWGKGGVARYLGIMGVLVPLAVYFYYVLIEAWCLAYCWDYVAGGLDLGSGTKVSDQVAAAKTHFSGLVGAAENGASLKNTEFLVFFAITTLLNVWYVQRGLSKGIEFVCKWAMPTMGI